MIVVHMIGNAHVDPVWLWGWQAGVDEAVTTLSAAADRCDEYPDFIFTCGESWLYRQVERLRPDLFARIRRHVTAGQWAVVGGTYVQPDLNLPTWVALERQILHGQAYFRNRFGVAPRIGYNVDSFGQSAFLPDMFAAHGYTAYVFGRPGPEQVPLPYSAFLWRGASGAELPAFRIFPGYAESVADLGEHIARALAQSDRALGHTMCFYGVGNHGGGPTRRQIEWIREHRTALPGVELRMSSPQAFFDAIAPRRALLSVVEGELQHCFPGCYSVMGTVKRTQRQGEHLLDQAGRAIPWCSGDDATRRDMAARIDAAWEDLLFTAFHDIVTGTSVPSAWRSCRAMQGRARIIGEEVLLDVTRGWAARTLPGARGHEIVVVNTDDTPFDGIVEHETWLDHEVWEDRYLADADGEPIVFQQTQPESGFRVPRLLFPLCVPAHGAEVVRLYAGKVTGPALDAGALSVSPTRLGNGRFAVTLDGTGIAGIDFDGRALLGDGGMTLQLRRDLTDTWGSGADRWTGDVLETLRGGTWEVEETGPLRSCVRMEHRIGTSRLRWTVALHRDAPRLHMCLEVNFDERFTLLQLALNILDGVIARTDAVPGGTVQRGLSAVEYSVQGWSRLRYPTHDMAMLSQDAFSLSATEGLWQWTLLRSPRMAWPGSDPPVYHHRDDFADQGVHEFEFALHADERLDDAALETMARRMAQKLVTFERAEGTARPF